MKRGERGGNAVRLGGGEGVVWGSNIVWREGRERGGENRPGTWMKRRGEGEDWTRLSR